MSYFERLYKCPEQNSDGVTLSQEFDETSSSEQTKKSYVDEIFLKRKKKMFKFEKLIAFNLFLPQILPSEHQQSNQPLWWNRKCSKHPWSSSMKWKRKSRLIGRRFDWSLNVHLKRLWIFYTEVQEHWQI